MFVKFCSYECIRGITVRCSPVLVEVVVSSACYCMWILVLRAQLLYGTLSLGLLLFFRVVFF